MTRGIFQEIIRVLERGEPVFILCYCEHLMFRRCRENPHWIFNQFKFVNEGMVYFVEVIPIVSIFILKKGGISQEIVRALEAVWSCVYCVGYKVTRELSRLGRCYSTLALSSPLLHWATHSRRTLETMLKSSHAVFNTYTTQHHCTQRREVTYFKCIYLTLPKFSVTTASVLLTDKLS